MPKTNLARLLARRPDVIFVDPFEQGEIGPDLFTAACNLGLGMVSKRADRPYRAGRSNWHFADIAGPIGGAGERVTTRRELAAALDRAVNRHGHFSLVEVMLPRGATSGTLARFVSGFISVRAAKA